MTDKRDKLIDSILEQYSVWESRRAFHLAMRALLKRELSDKLILDRKQVEEMIEKRKKLSDDTFRAFDGMVSITYNECIKDLNSLLTNQANDGE